MQPSKSGKPHNPSSRGKRVSFGPEVTGPDRDVFTLPAHLPPKKPLASTSTGPFPPEVSRGSSSTPLSSPADWSDSSDEEGEQYALILDLQDDSGIGFPGTLNEGAVEAVGLARQLKHLDVTREPWQQLCQLQTALEYGVENSKALFEYSSSEVPEQMLVAVHNLYERLQSSVAILTEQKNRLSGPEAQATLTRIDQLVAKIIKLKDAAQGSRERLKEDIDEIHAKTLKKVDALQRKYEKDSRELQDRLRKA
ncbi:hypothetical protein JCM8202_005530 [Rhodotorula sphaerocarpa]